MASAERRVYVVRGALGRSAVAGRLIAMIAISETCIFDEQAKEYVSDEQKDTMYRAGKGVWATKTELVH